MQRVYLHGLGQTPEDWEAVLMDADDAQRGVCPNLAALLQGKDPTYSNLYAAVSALCDGMDGAINLCGLSLGGVLALHYAIEHPQKVSALVLIAPQYKMPKTLLRAQNLLFHFMPGAMFRQTGFEKKAFLRLCGTMMDLDFSDSLSEITCPTLVLCGEKDSANRKTAEKLAGMLKHGTLQIIPGAGHEVNRDAPDALRAALRGFYHRAD